MTAREPVDVSPGDPTAATTWHGSAGYSDQQSATGWEQYTLFTDPNPWAVYDDLFLSSTGTLP